MQNNIRKIKLVFVLPSFLVGGIERQLVRQLRYYDRSKYNLSLILLFDYDKQGLIKDLPEWVDFYQYAFNKSKIKSFIKLFRYLRSSKPDVVISSMSSANLLAGFLKFFFPYKLIVREHNIYTDKKIYHRALEFVLSFFVDQIVAVSEGVANFHSRQAHIPRKKYAVINNGIDLSEINLFCEENAARKEKIKEEFGFSNHDKVIINVARLKDQKRHDLLIRSFNLLVAEDRPYKLLILGDGNMRPSLEKLIDELSLQGSVILKGSVSNVFDHYLISDLFVLSSDREGFPNVLLESMAFGVPVITTPVPGTKEIIKDGENSFLVDGNISSLKDKINFFFSLSDEEQKKLKSNAIDTAKKFSIDKIVSTYDLLIQNLLEKN